MNYLTGVRSDHMSNRRVLLFANDCALLALTENEADEIFD